MKAQTVFPYESAESVLKAVATILRVEEGGSILDRARLVQRRYDDMARELGKDWK